MDLVDIVQLNSRLHQKVHDPVKLMADYAEIADLRLQQYRLRQQRTVDHAFLEPTDGEKAVVAIMCAALVPVIAPKITVGQAILANIDCNRAVTPSDLRKNLRCRR